jgi:hypothetical protein
MGSLQVVWIFEEVMIGRPCPGKDHSLIIAIAHLAFIIFQMVIAATWNIATSFIVHHLWERLSSRDRQSSC